jgi:hypothetical protein
MRREFQVRFCERLVCLDSVLIEDKRPTRRLFIEKGHRERDKRKGQTVY